METLQARPRSWQEQDKLLTAIGERKPFRTGGALRGSKPLVGNFTTGQLLEPWDIRFTRDWADHGIKFVVWSYYTPIAWFVTDKHGDGWVIPPEYYSPTTAQHQSRVRTAVHKSYYDVLSPERIEERYRPRV